MPPQGGNKRKRGDRTYSEDDMNRPSPHRPGNLELARHHQPQSPVYNRNGHDGRGRGNRRSSRGGRNSMESSRQYSHNNIDAQTPTNKSTPAANERAPSQPVMRSTPDVPAPSPPVSEPAPVLRPYRYAYLTVETIDDWLNQGKSKIQADLDVAVSSEDELTLLTIVQELVHAATTRAIPSKEAGGVIHLVLEKDEYTESQKLLVQNAALDALSITFEDNQSLQRETLTEFIQATGVDEDVLRQEFDQDLLQKLGLIRSTFVRMGIRKQTNVLYRQANFNLMREESEGFAKLMTELFTTSGNEPPTGEVVEQTVEQVKAMIGAFDLDVGRSLDVVLDVFGAVLVKQFRFFVKFLRASPWWPRSDDTEVNVQGLGSLPPWAQPGIQDWKLSEDDQAEMWEACRLRDNEFWPKARNLGLRAFQHVGKIEATLEQVEQAKLADPDDLVQQWIKETGTLPGSSNRDAAQLLGFKLRFYSSSASRDPSDILPDHLIYLSALLIKIGFISLSDLYSHIWRSDDEMEELKTQKLKEKAERERASRPGAGVRNALLLAGALADDTLPIPARLREPTTRSGTPAREAEPEKPAIKDPSIEPLDQKVLLLKSLLAIGALPEALFILGRFPWIVDLYPELPEYIHRIMHHSLSQVYNSLRPLQDRDSLQKQKAVCETDVPGVPKGQVRLVDAPQKRILRWAQLDKNDSNDGTDYRFYWDEWNDNIPVCHNVEDVFTLCQTILPLVGVKIGHDPSLVLKLTRIGKHSLNEDTSEKNRSRWLDLIKKVLLPSLSLTKPNAGVINEVFDFISNYPTSTRYIMYIEWSSGRVSRNPDVKAAFDQAKAETKDILKRISKTNLKPMARSLAKIAYANPHVVITTALAQIEAYDSIAEVFVEGSRYFTDLGYDVLNWALISSMARAGRNRIQEDGLFTSRWLIALSQFAGKIYKRYSMMKPGPVLQYVSEQLDQGNSTDLKMLEQITVAMAGITTDTNFNDAQLQAMGGGPLLQSQTILQLLDRRNDSKTSSKRLLKALQEHGLTAKFLVSMAQQRQACVFQSGDIPLKAVGNTFDEISRIMNQYLDFLRSGLSTEDFQKSVPDVAQLLIEYQIPAEIAFWIARPVLAKQMADFDKDATKVSKINGGKDDGTDVDMKDDSSEEDGEAIEIEDVATTVATPSEIEISETMEVENTDISVVPEKWNPVLRSVMNQIQDYLPQTIVDTIGVGFYVTFWQLSLYEINVPSKSYEDEMSRQKRKISAVTSDRSNVSASGAKARENTIKQHQQLIDDLLAENKDHLKAYSESRSRLQKEKDQWFANKQRQSAEINTALTEYCFLPRILCSPQDAFFCFKFIKFLHSNGTPNFRTLGFYDAFFRPDRLASLIFMCTSKESDNLGRFLCELLRDLARWHKDKNVYDREAFGSKKNLPGFAMKVENGKPQLLLDFENFRRILFKWHSNIYSALIKCLSSAEYMHVRNAISVLISISPVYPAVNFHGTALRKVVAKLGDTRTREDIMVAAKAVQGALSRREKEWIIPQAFRQGQGLEKSAEKNQQTPQSNMKDQAKEDEEGNVEEDGEAGEVMPSEMSGKSEYLVTNTLPEGNSRPSPVTSIEPARDDSRPSTANATSIPTRSVTDSSHSARRPGRAFESNRAHDLPRRVSPSRQQPTTNPPGRPELDTRNGHRDSPRMSSRLPLEEPIRPDSRLSQSRYGAPDRLESPYEPNHRHARPHERSQPERDDRMPRRDHDLRHNYDDRSRSDREGRLEREPRSDYPRVNERVETRPIEREVRTPYETSERKRLERPDLVDDRRPGTSTMNRNATASPAATAINPERAALINIAEQRSGMSIRGQAQEKSRGSRTSSPRRDEDRRTVRPEREERVDKSDRPDRTDRIERPERADRPERVERAERVERSDRSGRSERTDRPDRLERTERPERLERPERSERLDRHARAEVSDRADRPERTGSERRQDLLAGQPSSMGQFPRPGNSNSFSRDSRTYAQPPIDMQHGRLEPESPVRAPPPPERSLPEPEVPSGPRSRPSNGSRRGPPPTNMPPQSQVPDRPPPTGPAKHLRGGSNFEPTPSGPIAPDTAGVHPDRMNLVAANESRPPQRPPPVNTQAPPPSGPRNGPGAPPAGPSPNSRNPPTGPQMDGPGRGRRHPLAAVNNTLAQASGPAGRGRGGPRQSGQFQPMQSPVQGSRPDFTQSDPMNPNGVPVQPRPQSSRRESSRDMRPEDDARNRARHGGKEGRPEEQRTNERRDPGQREQRGYRASQEESSARKHNREDSGQYPSGPARGGARTGNDSKRPRRGG